MCQIAIERRLQSHLFVASCPLTLVCSPGFSPSAPSLPYAFPSPEMQQQYTSLPQLSINSIFCATYAISPPTRPPDTR